MNMSTLNNTDADLKTDAVSDQPRDVIKNEISIEDTNDNGATGQTSTQDGTKSFHLPVNTSNIVPPCSASTTNVGPSESSPNSTKDNKRKSARKDDKKSIPEAQGAKNIVYNIKQSTGIHIGNNVVIGLQCVPNSSKTSPSTPVKETKEIKKLLQSTEPVTLDDIELVSSHVGANWMEVGRRLKYTDGQLEQFYEDNGRHRLKEVVYRMLLDWKQVNTRQASVGVLCNALWSSKQHDAVSVLEKKKSKKS